MSLSTTPRSNQRWWFLSAAVILFGGAVLFGIGFLLLDRVYQGIVDHTTQSLDALADSTRESLRYWRGDHLSLLEQLKRDPTFVEPAREQFAAYARDGSIPYETNEALRRFFNRQAELFGRTGFFLIAPDGTSLASMRDANMGLVNPIFAHRPDLFARVMRGEAVFVPPIPSDVPLGEVPRISGQPVPPTAFFVVPVRDEAGNVLGGLSQRILVDRDFATRLTIGHLGETGECVAFDAQGRLLSTSRFRLELEAAQLIEPGSHTVLSVQLRDPGPLPGPNGRARTSAEAPLVLPVERALAGVDGHDRSPHRDYRGVEVFSAWRWDEELGLGILAKIDAAEALEPYTSLRWSVALPLVLGFGAWVAVTLLVGRRLNRQQTVLARRAEILADRVRDRSIALGSSESRFRTLVDNVPGIVYRCALDDDWTMAYISDFVLAMTGYPSEDFVQNKVRTFASIIHPEDASTVAMQVHQAVRTDGHFILEYRIVRRDGSIRWVHEKGVVVRDSEGEVDHLDGVILDVTTRHQAEQTALEQTRLLQTITDHIPAIIFMKDREGRYLMVNRAWEQATGRLRHKTIGLDDGALDLPDAAAFAEQDRIVSTTHQRHETEMLLRHPDGSAHTYQFKLAPVLTEGGRMRALVGVGIDITSRKTMEDQLALARDGADAANRTKSAFLANITHEIRTPLNAILGYSRLLQRQPALTDEQYKYLRTINTSGEHLLNLINAVLEMSKIESGRSTFEPQQFVLREFLNQLQAMFLLRTKEKRLELAFEIADDLPTLIETDEGRLRQILINLLSNALKFTHQGSIRLEARRTRPTGTDPRRIGLTFEVIDTGEGIEANEFGQIFKAFGQTRSGRNHTGGTGLGLSISKEFAHLLGGDLTFTSKPGAGSRFTLTIQANVIDEAEGSAGAITLTRVVGLEPGSEPLRILVIDDNDVNRDVLTLLLREIGLWVAEAPTGEEAIRCFEAEPIDLVFIDVTLPMIHSLKTVRELRARPRGDRVRVIALSASLLNQDRAEIARAEIDEIIDKPYREEALFAAISRQTGRHFKYAPIGSSKSPFPREDRSHAEAIRALPADLRHRLEEVVLSGALHQIDPLVEQLRGDHPELAEELASLAADFNLGQLRALVGEGKNEPQDRAPPVTG